MGNITSKHLGINRSKKTEEYEVSCNLKEHGKKGLRAIMEQYNVECFEDITPTIDAYSKKNHNS